MNDVQISANPARLDVALDLSAVDCLQLQAAQLALHRVNCLQQLFKLVVTYVVHAEETLYLSVDQAHGADTVLTRESLLNLLCEFDEIFFSYLHGQHATYGAIKISLFKWLLVG